MTETAAQEAIAAMVAASDEPTLDELEVDALVRLARRPDASGLLPTDAGWTGTYDLNGAAAEGWRRKAGKVAGRFNFSTDGQSFQRAEMYKACLEMARHYAKRISTSVVLVVPDRRETEVIGN